MQKLQRETGFFFRPARVPLVPWPRPAPWQHGRPRPIPYCKHDGVYKQDWYREGRHALQVSGLIGTGTSTGLTGATDTGFAIGCIGTAAVPQPQTAESSCILYIHILHKEQTTRGRRGEAELSAAVTAPAICSMWVNLDQRVNFQASRESMLPCHAAGEAGTTLPSHEHLPAWAASCQQAGQVSLRMHPGQPLKPAGGCRQQAASGGRQRGTAVAAPPTAMPNLPANIPLL
jgi:hypothetical protein